MENHGKTLKKDDFLNYYDLNKKMEKGKKYPKLRRARIVICPICNKEFRAIKEQNGKYGGKKRIQKYCSKDCWNHRQPPKEKECRYCGLKYMSYESEKKVYCSQECRNLDHRERQKGENSHFWKGGLTKRNKILRSRKAYDEWRKSVFKRDNYSCVECNRKKTYLQAHHKTQVSKNPNLIYDINNGETLCLNCHQRKHPELKLNIKKVGAKWSEIKSHETIQSKTVP